MHICLLLKLNTIYRQVVDLAFSFSFSLIVLRGVNLIRTIAIERKQQITLGAKKKRLPQNKKKKDGKYSIDTRYRSR